VVKYHGLARRYLIPSPLLMRPLLNGGMLGRNEMCKAWGLATFFLSVACAQPKSATEPRPFVRGSTFAEARPRPNVVESTMNHAAIRLADWAFEVQPSPIVANRQLPLYPNYLAWAQFLNAIHARVHPGFARHYLPSLDALPPGSLLADLSLNVQVELHLVPRTGKIHRLGVRRSSGVRDFDVAVLVAFSKAFPMPFPEALSSSDGYAYLLWDVSRDPKLACSTLQAHPVRIAPAK
jgi:hypothetical protein